MDETVVLYSKDSCPWCDRAKELLQSKNIAYTELKFNVDFTREQLAEKLPDKANRLTLPQIFIDGENIGGYEDLRDYISLITQIDALKQQIKNGKSSD
jgi:glutaredoxin 3